MGLEVPPLGLGCMSMSEFYGASNEREAIATLHRAIELGVSFLDTADVYGQGHNEELIGRAIAGRRDEVVLATKFGVLREPDGSFVGVKGAADYVRRCCEASLRRLGVEVIDLYYQHRVDPKTPIEETVGAMAALVGEGKVISASRKPRPRRSAVRIRCILLPRCRRILALEPRARRRHPRHSA
jgi:aryl-alcohol dehydrogenase-like predicted oxidoreductase